MEFVKSRIVAGSMDAIGKDFAAATPVAPVARSRPVFSVPAEFEGRFPPAPDVP